MKKKIIIISIIFILLSVIFLSIKLLDNNSTNKKSISVDKSAKKIKNVDKIPTDYLDEGIFKDYYNLAYKKLKTLSLDEKIGQLLLVRFSDSEANDIIEKYKVGGFVFFAKDFKEKTEKDVKDMIETLQKQTKIPLLTAVDEEGGIVVRISNNPLLASSKFKSPQELYAAGGFESIKRDTINKSKLLYNLGINLNLAPVVDVSTNSNDYMYQRSFGENSNLTSEYAKTVIEASKDGNVSYTLKHFPGYGNNIDTHTGSSTDNRTYQDILNNDLPPFESGINAGAESVLVSHNIVSSIDGDNPASLSTSIHKLLRDNLKFTGVIITDDLAMGATSNIDNVYVKAILSGNDLLITTDYIEPFNEIKNAVESGDISEELINRLAFRILAWKYYKGLMLD